MDKVINIHLAGMLFTIEEQAYQELKSYLDQLHLHFKANTEIVNDIEARMAELFQHKLGSNRNTLFLADVQDVCQTLGNIAQMDEHLEAKSIEPPLTDYPNSHHNKLRRNGSDQNLGGVCSGMASFFNVDPVLMRVLFVLLLIAFGSGVLLYLILWIVMPLATGDEAEYMRIQNQMRTKKLFRDADARMVGGVSAGLSNYFGIDKLWIRLAFLVSILLFGTGFWLYIILWIIVPKAISASDKLLMKGEAANIQGFEKSHAQGVEYNKINNIAQHGSNVLGKIVKGAFKIFGGLFALLLFFIIISISIAMLAVFLKLGQVNFFSNFLDFTVRNEGIIIAAKFGILLTLLLPFLGLLMIVLKSIFNLKFINKNWGFITLGLFLIGVVSLSYAGTKYATSISETASKASIHKIAEADTLHIGGLEMPFSEPEEGSNSDLQDMNIELAFQDKGIVMDENNFYVEINNLKIKQGRSDSIVVKVLLRANGSNEIDAQNKIEMMEYNFKIDRNKLIIPAYYSLAKDKQFSWQEVDVTIWVPKGKTIHLDPSAKEILDDINLDEADGEYYKFENGELICTDCDGDSDTENIDQNDDANYDYNAKGEANNMNLEIRIKANKDNKTKVEKK